MILKMEDTKLLLNFWKNTNNEIENYLVAIRRESN